MYNKYKLTFTNRVKGVLQNLASYFEIMTSLALMCNMSSYHLQITALYLLQVVNKSSNCVQRSEPQRSKVIIEPPYFLFTNMHLRAIIICN